MTEVWVLGGSGRSGRAIAAALRDRDLDPVLVGRDGGRLAVAAAGLGGCRTEVMAGLADIAARIRSDRPAAVVNTVGPFSETMAALTAACLDGGSHHVDLANDVGSVSALLALDRQAADAGLTFVTGAGWGVTGTESAVLHVCEGRSVPRRVRVDMIPSLASEAGALGDALAGTIVDGHPGVPGGGRFDGRRYAGGRLVRSRVAGDVRVLRLPDGSTVRTGAMPLGELVSAQRVSGAPDVVSASSEAPTAPLVRAVLPGLLQLLRVDAVRRLARRRLAAVALPQRARPRQYSWARAEVAWPDGDTRVGWLRAGDAAEFTAAVAAEVTHRALSGAGRPGCSTPAAMFGTGLATACGAEYLSDPGTVAGTPVQP
jgi:short subunit dehydrogenase-like uncharacterized protein